MALLILFSLIALSLAEIAVFVLVGDAIGVGPTVALALIAGLAGLLVLRVQGVMTLVRVRDALNRGEAPTAELFDGACRLAGGILLLIPGFLTDLAGLALLTAPGRAMARLLLTPRLAGWTTHVWSRHPPGDGGPRAGAGRDRPGGPRGPVIEGEYEEVPPDPERDRRIGEEPRGDGEPRP